MVSPVSTPQPAASGRARLNAARVRQRWPFSGWAWRPGGPPDARPGQADHEAVARRPCTRSVNIAIVMSAWPSRTGCTSAPAHLADSARSPSRKSR